MKNWSKFITLSSVIMLASASPITAFADENTVVTSVPPSDVTVPTVPSEPTGEDVVTPTDPNVTVPTTPSTTEEPRSNTAPTPPSDTTVPSTGGEEPATPTEPSNPSTTKEPTSPSEPTEPKATDKPEEPSSDPNSSNGSTPTAEVPTINGGTTTIPTDVKTPTNNPNVSAQAAQNAGASQVGTTSAITGQVVVNVSPQAPINTYTGYQIVSTVNSQVVIQGSGGTTSTVSAEAVGGTVNEDKTISIKTASGEMTTLPSTGEKENFLMSLTGAGILAGLLGYFFKKKTVKGI